MDYELIINQAPLKFGSILRTPTFAWSAWGVAPRTEGEFIELVELSESAYRSEWDNTVGQDHHGIRLAAEAAGLGGANQALNGLLGEVVKDLASRLPDTSIRVLDIGSGTGQTSEALLSALGKDKIAHLELHLLDPACRALEEASQNLVDAGYSVRNIHCHCETDLDHLQNHCEAFDLIVSTAAVHHHAFLDPLFGLIANALRPEGLVVIGDWHNRFSTHPSHLLPLLHQMFWKGKETALMDFEKRFDCSSEGFLDPREANADEQIRNFWLAYSQLRFGGPGRFTVLEGHRPVTEYVRLLSSVGLSVPSLSPSQKPNPRHVFPDSSLLAVTFAQKSHS